MIFKCNHDALMGKNGLCLACYNAGVVLPQPEKNKVGRPRTRTDEERLEQKRRLNREWARNNKDRRLELQRDHYRKHNGVNKGEWVVRLPDGLYARRERYSTPGIVFAFCHIYKNKANALKRVQRDGGDVMELMDTEQKTLANWEAARLRGDI